MVLGSIFFWPFMLGAGILVFLIEVLVLAFLIWMIVDCAQRRFRNKAEKWIWIVLMVLTNWVGAIIYYIAVRALNPRGVSKE